MAKITDDIRVQKIIDDAENKLEELLGHTVSLSIVKINAKKYTREKGAGNKNKCLPELKYPIHNYMTSKDVMRVIANELYMRSSDYMVDSREENYVLLKKVGSYILKEKYGSAYKQIARLFRIPGEDHTMPRYYNISANGLINLGNPKFCNAMEKVINKLNDICEKSIKSEENAVI